MNSIFSRPISIPIMQNVLRKVQSGQTQSMWAPSKVPLDQCSACFRSFYEAAPASIQKCFDAVYDMYQNWDIRGEAQDIFSNPDNVYELLNAIQTGQRAYLEQPDGGRLIFILTTDDNSGTLQINFVRGFLEHDTGIATMKLDIPVAELHDHCSKAIDDLIAGPRGVERGLKPFT